MKTKLKLVVVTGLTILLASMPTLAKSKSQPKGKEDINTKGFTSSEVCGSCHTFIHNYWKNSMHAISMTDPIFRVAHMQARAAEGPEIDKFCLSCHAPTTVTTKAYDISDPITKEGITCDFCHTVKEVDLKSKGFPYINEPGVVKRSVIKNAKSPAHEVEYSPLFGKSEFCAGCHELKSKSGAVIMGTYSEWLAGPYPKEGKQCQNCHMPLIDRPVVDPAVKVDVSKSINKHDVSGSHNLTQLKKAAVAKIKNVTRNNDKISIQVEVENNGSGHKIPTGIPTRKLVLKVCAEGGNSRTKGISACQEIVYEKVLVDIKGKVLTTDHEAMLYSHKVKSDNRIGPKETRLETVTLRFPGGQDAVVKAELYYLYTPLVIDTAEMKVKLSSVDKVVSGK